MAWRDLRRQAMATTPVAALLGARGDRCPGASFAVLTLINALALIACVALAAAPSVGHKDGHESSLDRVLRTATLRVGSPLDYAPFSVACGADGAHAIGSDVDAVRSLARSLGASVVIVPTTWSDLVESAASFDVAVGGITPTLERRRHVGFTQAYAHGGKVAVARCGSPLLVQLQAAGGDLASLNRPSTHTVVNPGGTNERLMRSALPLAELVVVDQNGDQYDELLSRAADLTITDQVEAQLMELRYPGRLCASASLLTTESKAYMLARDDLPWLVYLNSWLQTWMDGGSANASLAHWLALLAADANASFCDPEAGVTDRKSVV